MFTAFECADCGSIYAPTEGGCACTGCGDYLAWADVLLEWGEVETVDHEDWDLDGPAHVRED